MTIDKLEAENVKGIKNFSKDLKLHPNIPIIFVAPNGFGKSSLTCGFAGMQTNRLNLSEKNHFDGKLENKPCIKITIDGQEYVIDETSTTLPRNIGIDVINSKLIAKAKGSKYGSATAHFEIKTVEIVQTVPEKVKFHYKVTQFREAFGKNGNVVLGNEKELFKNSFMIECYNIYKADGVKEVIEYLKRSKKTINDKETIDDRLLIERELKDLENSINSDTLTAILERIKRRFDCNYLAAFSKLWQIFYYLEQKGSYEYIKWLQYEKNKKELDEMLKSTNSTRFTGLASKEVKKNGKTSLVVEFPKLDISNGQRDILTFVAQIQKIKFNIQKETEILIIDEIFDYLDAGNLIAMQYFITELDKQYKEKGKNLFPILMTHLDPSTFNNYYFRKKQTVYLKAKNDVFAKNQCVELAKLRTDISNFKTKKPKQEKSEFQEEIEACYFHYSDVEKESPKEVTDINGEWKSNFDFRNFVYGQVENYLKNATDDEDYEPIAVMFAVRIKIEENCYNMLPENLRQEFINTHKTTEKIKLCEEHGVEIPEYYSLLGILHNDLLHWRENVDYITPVRQKLENPVIKRMVRRLFEDEINGKYC